MKETEEIWRREVRELHRFFERWMTGQLARTEEAFVRFADAMDEEFEIITPEGRRIRRAPLLSSVREAHGAHDPGTFRIRVEDPETRFRSDGVALVTYEEWQTVGDEPRGRLSSALLRRDEAGPEGVVWLHAHETWLEHD